MNLIKIIIEETETEIVINLENINYTVFSINGSSSELIIYFAGKSKLVYHNEEADYVQTVLDKYVTVVATKEN